MYDRASSGIGERFPESNIQSKVGPLAKPGLPSASPGANASTFFGRVACQRMLRLILKGRCRPPKCSFYIEGGAHCSNFSNALAVPRGFSARKYRGGSPFDRARKKFVVCLMLADLELSTFQKTSKCGWAVCATTKTHWQTVGSGAPLGVSV